MNYKDSGVDIDAGNAFVSRLKEKAPNIGGFNGLYPVPTGYEEPVLVSGTDGVGTKINMCKVFNDYTTIGIDLVAMCVNDVITCGAKPMYFLDYISTGKISPIIDQIMEGVIKGCEIARIELIGGETAEHPRHAPPPAHDDDIDLAGFSTGVVEKSEIIDGRLIRSGDKIIGLPSSGLHSNGYSLINDMLWRHKISYKDMPELLTPTTIYAMEIQHLMNTIPIMGMAHITGGGLQENINRVIPQGVSARIDWTSWERPDIFNKIKGAGDINEEEMRRVFNCGIGYAIIIPRDIDYGTQIGEIL
jgi:phosphoribosylformylglycinamidine cyclo-ligase